MTAMVAPTAPVATIREFMASNPLLAGERMLLLVGPSGTPWRLALHWGLARRQAAQSQESIRGGLRHIGHLYASAQAVLGIDLDRYVLGGGLLGPERLEILFQHYRQAVLTGRRGKGTRLTISPHSVNQAVRSWGAFAIWLLTPSNYRATRPREENRAALVERMAIQRSIEGWVERSLVASSSRKRHALSGPELQALADVVCRRDDDTYPAGFSPANRLRNEVIYHLARTGGLRRGEILKLQTSDIGPSTLLDPSAISYSPAPGEPGPDQIRILRRPDDPMDPRAAPPRVKTAERIISLPPWVISDLHDYRRTRPRSDGSYLLLSDDGSPLSIPALESLGRRLGALASEAFTSFNPGRRSTLVADPATRQEGFTWHRLRHTRAQELLAEFKRRNEGTAIDKLMLYFGWRSIGSALPYISASLAEEANRESLLATSSLSRQAARVTFEREGS